MGRQLEADYPPLMRAQLDALRRYAEGHGRCWKAALRDEWIYASADPLLHGLRRASLWRRARRDLDRRDPATRQTLLDYWNRHRWLPGDPTYLLDMLHGFDSGRLRIVEGQVQPAKVVISVAEAMDMPTAAKPVAGGWLGKRA